MIVGARRTTLLLTCASALMLAALALPASALALLSLEFSTPPALPTLPALTLNAQSQTLSTAMTNFAVSDTRLSKSGWNITAAGQSGTGKSPVFAQYCPKASCGTDPEGYVAGGQSLAASSLRLSSTGASMTGSLGSTGSTPQLQCAASCALDSASAVKIVSAETSEGTWTTTGWSATSLQLSAPTTLKALPSGEVYRVNILWTLASGP